MISLLFLIVGILIMPDYPLVATFVWVGAALVLLYQSEADKVKIEAQRNKY